MALGSSARASAWVFVVALAAALGGCSSGGTGYSATGANGGDGTPFADAAPPSIYVPRVKMLLTGQPATDDEVQLVTSDPAALRGLVDQWMRRPEFRARMEDFFRNAFQQNNVDLEAVSSALDIPDFYLRWEDRDRFARMLQDSFPLTAWQLVQEGRPFTETLGTRRYMMTTAMMAALSYADLFEVDDSGEDRSERLWTVTGQRPVLDVLATRGDGTPLTLEDSIGQFRPGGAGDWTWRIGVERMTDACRGQVLAQRLAGNEGYAPERPRWERTASIFGVLFGSEGYINGNAERGACAEDDTGANGTRPLLADSDWSDWRMVTISPIPLGDPSLPSPLFFDLPALRAATVLRLKSPRAGFFGTLAWDVNWPTNSSNQARVTANQVLIVALGQSIIPATAVAPAPLDASDASHSANPACAACHNVLDPLRNFFRQSYTYSYHEQRDPAQVGSQAAFLLGGMNQAGRGTEDLAAILAAHPHFPVGWAQKLQFWANSTAADESDPELQRIAQAFQASGFDFRTLVREVFTSPLVTLAGGTSTYRNQGVTIGIARRDQLCAAFSARLGLDDACGQQRDPGWQRSQVRNASQLIATDMYYRAAELPAMPRDPDLFFRNGVEAMCRSLSTLVVDEDDSRWSSDTPAEVDAALADFAARVMALPPSDPRSAPAAAVLREHYQAALAATNRTAALRSTFVLACISPSSVLVGL